MDTLTIKDLELWTRIGVTEAERSQPQKLLATIEWEGDFTAAAAQDDLNLVIDYYAVSRRLLQIGAARSWKLIETAAVEMADIVLNEFHAARVTVEVKKFVLPEAQWVSAKVTRARLQKEYGKGEKGCRGEAMPPG